MVHNRGKSQSRLCTMVDISRRYGIFLIEEKRKRAAKLNYKKLYQNLQQKTLICSHMYRKKQPDV